MRLWRTHSGSGSQHAAPMLLRLEGDGSSGPNLGLLLLSDRLGYTTWVGTVQYDL